MIFDQQLKVTFRKSSAHPEKIHSPPKNSKSASPPLFPKMENFSGPPAERGEGHCGNTNSRWPLLKNLILSYIMLTT